MNGLLLGLIILTAIVGGYIIDYQKNKVKWQAKNTHIDDEVDELRTLVHKMKKRIENLEAIAAGEPDDFKNERADPLDKIKVEDEDEIKTENEKKVSKIAKSKGE